jgi:UDP-hydrolysing UDP-N-acetyl-D-glucosamine 2-epimerase
MNRRIAVVTSSRADYSHLYWPLHDLAAHPEVDLRVIVIGPHLSPEFGCTAKEIEGDGFANVHIECLLSSDTDVGMAKTIGVATLGLADCLAQMRPDILLVTADRFEMLAPAMVALTLRIPLAHIEGGEVSEGAIDDQIRNALTKLSHIHFTSTELARTRVIAMGEEPWRVHCAGAPSLDHLRRSPLYERETVEQRLGIALAHPAVIVTYHPVTMYRDTIQEADAVFDALKRVPGQLLFCYPNADAGSRDLIARARSFLQGGAHGKVFTNLDAVTYWSLLRQADLVLGNSSSGIMEAASFAVPAVNVGIRQRGREHGRNVIHADAHPDAILQAVEQALTSEFRKSLQGMANLYGDGRATERIVQVLTTLTLNQDLSIKRAPEVPAAGRAGC